MQRPTRRMGTNSYQRRTTALQRKEDITINSITTHTTRTSQQEEEIKL